MEGLQRPSLQGSRRSGGAPRPLPQGTAGFSVILGLSRDQHPVQLVSPRPKSCALLCILCSLHR